MREELLSLIKTGYNQYQDLIKQLGGNYTTREIDSAITELLCNDTISYEPNIGYVLVDYSKIDAFKPRILDAIRRRYYSFSAIADYIGVDVCDNEFVLALKALKADGAIVYSSQFGYLIGKESKQDKVISGVLSRAYCALEYLKHEGTPSYIGKVSRLVALAERIAAKYQVAEFYAEMLELYREELTLIVQGVRAKTDIEANIIRLQDLIDMATMASPYRNGVLKTVHSRYVAECNAIIESVDKYIGMEVGLPYRDEFFELCYKFVNIK